MQSAPNSIANTTVISFRPARPAPGLSAGNRTNRSTNCSTPNRAATVATSTIPASATTRSSSNTTRIRSSPTAPLPSTTKVTS